MYNLLAICVFYLVVSLLYFFSKFQNNSKRNYIFTSEKSSRVLMVRIKYEIPTKVLFKTLFSTSFTTKIIFLGLRGLNSNFYYKLKWKCSKRNCSISRSARDRNLYIVLEEKNELQSLNHSFAELDLFPEAPTDVVWKFVSNLKHRPYETTMETFSKLTDVFCK